MARYYLLAAFIALISLGWLARGAVMHRAGPVCERDGVAHLRCRRGHSVVVRQASWGRRDARTCSRIETPDRGRDRPGAGRIEEQYLRNTDCHTPRATQIARSKCDGQRRCVIPATNEALTNPCPGTYKYLSVEYECHRS